VDSILNRRLKPPAVSVSTTTLLPISIFLLDQSMHLLLQCANKNSPFLLAQFRRFGPPFPSRTRIPIVSPTSANLDGALWKIHRRILRLPAAVKTIGACRHVSIDGTGGVVYEIDGTIFFFWILNFGNEKTIANFPGNSSRQPRPWWSQSFYLTWVNHTILLCSYLVFWFGVEGS
jgi:hypothetical protein